MKSLGLALYAVGAVLAVIALLWMGTGFYGSDIPVILVLIGLGLGLLFLGNRLHRDENPTQAVAWKPSEPLQSAAEVTMIAGGQDDAGEMVNCLSCGKPTRVEAEYCGNCGAKLPEVAPVREQAPPSSSPSQASSMSPPPPPPPPPPAASATTSAPPAPAQPAVTPPQPDTVAPAQPGALAEDHMITLPPGLVPSPPATERVDTPSPAAPISDAVFITSPGIPAVAPPAEDLDATRVSTRRRAGSPWRLVLPDGQHHVVDGAVLIGRNPSPSAQWPNATLLPVDDTTRSVSKTHAVIEADADGLWITDLASTNGVVVVAPGGRELDGDGGARLAVEPGSDIELGDFVIQVEKDS